MVTLFLLKKIDVIHTIEKTVRDVVGESKHVGEVLRSLTF